MITALLLLAVPICIADLSSFKIPNIYTKLLLYSSLIHIAIFGFISMHATLTSIAILALLFFFGTGMGDLKLLGLIFLTVISNPLEFIATVFVIAIIQIVISGATSRLIPRKIAFAPSIFLGLATYLATR